MTNTSSVTYFCIVIFIFILFLFLCLPDRLDKKIDMSVGGGDWFECPSIIFNASPHTRPHSHREEIPNMGIKFRFLHRCILVNMTVGFALCVCLDLKTNTHRTHTRKQQFSGLEVFNSIQFNSVQLGIPGLVCSIPLAD
jgi:hypothetical protein